MFLEFLIFSIFFFKTILWIFTIHKSFIGREWKKTGKNICKMSKIYDLSNFFYFPRNDDIYNILM